MAGTTAGQRRARNNHVARLERTGMTRAEARRQVADLIVAEHTPPGERTDDLDRALREAVDRHLLIVWGFLDLFAMID